MKRMGILKVSSTFLHDVLKLPENVEIFSFFISEESTEEICGGNKILNIVIKSDDCPEVAEGELILIMKYEIKEYRGIAAGKIIRSENN